MKFVLNCVSVLLLAWPALVFAEATEGEKAPPSSTKPADTGKKVEAEPRAPAARNGYEVTSWEKTPEPVWAGEKRLEVLASLSFLFPSDGRWDSAPGGELKCRRWLHDRWGWAAAVGRNQWSFAEAPLDFGPVDFSPLAAEGDATLYPFSFLACCRHPLGEALELVGEAGLRYVVVDSEVEVSVAYTDHFGRDVSYSSFVENENHLMGAAALELRRRFQDKALFALGGEFQFDISADRNWLMEDVANDFNAFGLRASIGVEW